MNFQQLRILREAARRDCNLTEVANALFTSQSGVSKHIRDLEEELGVELFVRRGKRLLGPTEPGIEMTAIARRMLRDAADAQRLAERFAQRDEGLLRIATTHTQARYALPPVVRAFMQEFPKVQLVLHQAEPAAIVTMLLEGEADLGIATEALDAHREIASFPFYRWRHAVIVPHGHALQRAGSLTLEAIAEHPVVTYHDGYTGRARIDAAFTAANLSPRIALTALDADVIKTYVELGLGVGIVASMAVVPERDTGLARLEAAHLFPENVARIGVRRGRRLRDYAYRFVQRCSPEASELALRAAREAHLQEFG